MKKKYTHKRGTCELCGRTDSLRRHHLKPKAKKSKKSLIRDDIAWLCVDCTNQVHALFTRRELTKYYFNINLLKAAPAVRKYISWVRKRKIIGLHPSMKR